MPSSKTNPTIDENKLLAAISYLWILFLVPLLTKKGSPFVQFHARQGLVLFVAWIALWLVGWVPVLGWLIGFFGSILLTVLAIVGFIKALQGEQWELPVLGAYAKRVKL